jgi:hypothetical protein
MKRADRRRALSAARIHRKTDCGGPGIAARLKVDLDEASLILNRGILIEQSEAHRLTGNEQLVMTVLARLEARRVERGGPLCSIGEVDFNSGARSGWTSNVIAPRLRQARPSDAGVRDITNRLDFVANPKAAGAIWLTPAGWAFVWATGLITKNWKVPA